jgi:hypothetical protein
MIASWLGTVCPPKKQKEDNNSLWHADFCCQTNIEKIDGLKDDI